MPDNDTTLDWLCIPIGKQAEAESHCDYVFSSALFEPDLDNPGRHKVEKHHHGILRIHKSTGDIEVIQPMPGDDGERRAQRAARIIYRHWQKGEYPEHTIYAAG
jgi:hypothetical protein